MAYSDYIRVRENTDKEQKMTLISSQRYRDSEIVEAKRIAKDYKVSITPEFCIDGETVQAIIDGHHSHEAAIIDGVFPEYVVLTATDDDRIALLGDVDSYLEAAYVDSDWHYVETGRNVF